MERTPLFKVNPAEYDPFWLYRRLSVFRFSIIYQGKINGFAARRVQRQTTPRGLAIWLATQIIMTCAESVFMNRDLQIGVWKLLWTYADTHHYVCIMIAKTNMHQKSFFHTVLSEIHELNPKSWFSPLHDVGSRPSYCLIFIADLSLRSSVLLPLCSPHPHICPDHHQFSSCTGWGRIHTGSLTHTNSISLTLSDTHSIRYPESDNKTMPSSLIEFNPPILAAPLCGRSVITSVMTAPAHGWAYYTRTRLLHRICSYCHWCLGVCYFAFYKTFVWLLILHPGIFVFELQLSTRSILLSKKINVTSLPYLS